MRKKTKKAEPCDSKVDFMLGMSPTPGKRATLVIPKFTLDIGNNLGRTLRQQGGPEPCDSKVDFMLGMSPIPGKRATLVIPN
ncbi:MAG: hypothetical protein EBU82_15110 [Flavobacteriia bacterium]|nr:hypothetical protein [Flavobacteriia bacterium]